MLHKKLDLKRSNTSFLNKNTFPHVNSSIKLDSFLNYSQISNNSMTSHNSDLKKVKNVNKRKIKEKHPSTQKIKKENIVKDKKLHKNSSYCNNLDRSLNKNKNDLSQYILLNTSTKNEFYFPNIKLLGNSRYKYTSPIMFVEDQKNNMSDINLGLVPIPMERCKFEMSRKEESEREKKLYELQRSIVMLRRKQYNKISDRKRHKNQFIDYNSNSLKNEADDMSDYINKIILIQKWWNNHSKKKEMKNKLNRFEEILNDFINKRFFSELKKYLVYYKKPINLICFANKMRLRYTNNIFLNNNIELNINNKNFDVNLDKKPSNLNNFEIEDYEDSNDDLNINFKINDSNVNEEKNIINIKNLKIKINNVRNKDNDYNGYIHIPKKHKPEEFINFSNIIKKIFLFKLINKIKLNNNLHNNLLALRIFKPKALFISIIRKKIKNNLNFIEKQEITRIKDEMKYSNNEIFKIPINYKIHNCNNSNYSKNICFISKTRIGQKIEFINNINKINKKSNVNNIYSLEFKKTVDKMKDYSIESKKFKKDHGFYITKTILNQKFIKEKEKNINLESKIIYKQIIKNNGYIDKKRMKNYMKYIISIQNSYKAHLRQKYKNDKIKYKKPLNLSNYITITRLVESTKNLCERIKNLNYLVLLLKLFITKNIQEYIFIITNTKKIDIVSNINNYFPFYIRSLQRIMNYIKKNSNPNQKISLFIDEIFNYQKIKEKSYLKSICFLPEERKNKLLNSNIFTGYEEKELINFICDFSEFDKNLNNEIFIMERLKKIKLNNTNIFTLVKIIDVEYNNLVKGIYCFKCYNDKNLCNCCKQKKIIGGKSNYGSNLSKGNYKSEDNITFDDFDFMSEESDNKRQINYFDYDKKEEKDKNNILIKTKTMNNDNNKGKLINIILPINDCDKKDK